MGWIETKFPDGHIETYGEKSRNDRIDDGCYDHFMEPMGFSFPPSPRPSAKQMENQNKIMRAICSTLISGRHV